MLFLDMKHVGENFYTQALRQRISHQIREFGVKSWLATNELNHLNAYPYEFVDQTLPIEITMTTSRM